MFSQDLTSIGIRARSKRKELRLTQQEAATKIQSHRNDISEIENGKFKGSLITLLHYLNLLGYSLTVEPHRDPSFEELDSIFSEDD